MSDYQEYYIEITLHNSDYTNELTVIGRCLSEIIKYNNFNENDLFRVDEHFKEYVLEMFINYYIMRITIEAGSNNFTLANTIEYFKKHFSFKFILQEDINTDGNGEYLYIQITGREKGYIFIY